MKILIYGAGVIGCTYGWQLAEAGHDITIFVRKGQKQQIRENGIPIICQDFRYGNKKMIETVFRPHVIDELDVQNDFEYIIVATNKIQLPEVLPVLRTSAGKAHVLFFQNNWDYFDLISQYLKPEQYFFGFPFMVGGGRDINGIHSVISGMKYSHTPIGEMNGEITPRVQKIAQALGNANMKPVLSCQILLWIITHYAVAAGLIAGILSAGCAAKFVSDSRIIRMTIYAIREGFDICLKRGYDAKSEKANKLYRLPLFISVPIAKKIYSNEALQLMFDGHINHSMSEVRQMIEDMIVYGEKYNVATPNLIKLKNTMSVEKAYPG
ncbi:ketopantoate reductase family protein [Parabacteroides sp.]